MRPVILSPSAGRRTSRDVSDFVGPNRRLHEDLWPKSQATAFKSYTSREVLRPTEGLRMTSLGNEPR